MRFVTNLLLACVILFSGYWVLAASMGASQANAILERAPTLSGEAGRVRGYPLQFETRIQSPRWQNARGDTGWRSDSIAVTVPSLRPMSAKLEFPTEHAVDIAGQSHLLHTRDMTAKITAQTDLTLSAAEVTLEAATFDPPLGISTLAQLSGHLHHQTDRQYGVHVDASGIAISPDTLSFFDPEHVFPAEIASLQIAADLRFDAPLDLRRTMPAMTETVLNMVRLVWGDIEVGMTGQFTRDAAGALDGALRLSLSDWQVLHILLTSSGLLSDDAAMMAGMLLASLAEPGSTAVTLELDLSASSLSLGPFTLMQIPPL